MEFEGKIELPPAYASYAGVAAFTCLSVSTVRRMVARRDFPQPVYLAPRRPLFSIDAVRKWAAEREGAAA